VENLFEMAEPPRPRLFEKKIYYHDVLRNLITLLDPDLGPLPPGWGYSEDGRERKAIQTRTGIVAEGFDPRICHPRRRNEYISSTIFAWAENLRPKPNQPPKPNRGEEDIFSTILRDLCYYIPKFRHNVGEWTHDRTTAKNRRVERMLKESLEAIDTWQAVAMEWVESMPRRVGLTQETSAVINQILDSRPNFNIRLDAVSRELATGWASTTGYRALLDLTESFAGQLEKLV
jgi:hypothetical protein